MASSRLRLEGTSLEGLEAQIASEHGGTVRIVSVEKVTVGGIRGWFGRQHYEVVVEIPGSVAEEGSEEAGVPIVAIDIADIASSVVGDAARTGIAALLAEADDSESILNRSEPDPEVSTASESFAMLLDDLAANTAPERAMSRPVAFRPNPLRGPGDLVVLVGRGEAPLVAARAMAGTGGARSVRVSGALDVTDIGRVDNRRSALAARAKGVRGGHSVFVAFGLGPSGFDPFAAVLRAAVLHSVGADQVWAVVDEDGDPDDTDEWMRTVDAVVPIDAVLPVQTVAMVGVQHRLR